MNKTYHSKFPTMNAKLRNEPVAKYTIYCDTPAADDGSKCAQVFVGAKTMATDAHGMKSDNQFVKNLEHDVWQRGEMENLISDSEHSELVLEQRTS